jgi:glutamyl-Q tRNA(Asp) synthetase
MGDIRHRSKESPYCLWGLGIAPLAYASSKMYRGRFAPSPTGPLHFGSLVTAVASYLEARRNGGVWLVRIEDVDAPRSVPGAADQILRDLEAFGFVWDEAVLYQSQRTEIYQAALDQLRTGDLAYPCGCSRKEIDADRYPGTCSRGLPPGKSARAWRVRGNAADVGDFVLLRADGYFAYQLAVVVDDAAQGITDVVRGADLLDSTPRQIHLQSLLGYPTPRYQHVPLVLAADGQKLSKQTGATALALPRTSQLLADAFRFLGHTVPQELVGASVNQLWEYYRK